MGRRLIMVKAAVLVTGIFPAYLQRKDLQENLERTESIFPEFDFYYQTWDNSLCRHIFKDLKRDILWTKEPTHEYNGYAIAKERYDFSEMGIKRFFVKPKNDAQRNLLMRSCYQHIGFSQLYSQVPKKYDYYIRTRWDAYFDENFPLNDILNLCERGVVGIAMVPNNPRKMRGTKKQESDYDKIRVRRERIKHLISKSYCIIDAQTEQANHAAYENFLPDFCIIFRKEDYEEGSAEELFLKSELSASEYGWHELLCQKRKNINIDGLVSILRNVDSSYETYSKLLRDRLL